MTLTQVTSNSRGVALSLVLQHATTSDCAPQAAPRVVGTQKASLETVPAFCGPANPCQVALHGCAWWTRWTVVGGGRGMPGGPQQSQGRNNSSSSSPHQFVHAALILRRWGDRGTATSNHLQRVWPAAVMGQSVLGGAQRRGVSH